MTRDTKYVCDGCGTESTDNSRWSHPYFPNHGNKDLCVFCTSRIACSPYDASGAAREVEIGRLQEALKEATAEAQRANEENARLYKSLEEAREANEAALNRAEIAEERETALLHKVASLKTDHEYDEEVNCGLVLELLNMLGKKARRRNKQRLREIRLAVSMDVPGDDEAAS